VDAALALSHAHLELGNPEGARPGLEHAQQQQPENAQIRAELRRLYEHIGDQHALAKLLLEDAQGTEDKAEQVEMLLKAGQIFVDLGDAAAAVPALQKVLELQPGDSSTIVALCDAFIITEDYDAAHELLDGAIDGCRGRRTPETSMYYHRKAKVAASQEDLATQFALLQEAHLCNKKNGIVAAELADLAEELQEWDVAAKTLRTITLIDSEWPISKAQAYLRQGRIAQIQGDEKGAKMWARRARREDPESEEIEAFLNELG